MGIGVYDRLFDSGCVIYMGRMGPNACWMSSRGLGWEYFIEAR